MRLHKITAALASSAFFVALGAAHAQSIDVGVGDLGVSVGTDGGLSADISTGDAGTTGGIAGGATDGGAGVSADVSRSEEHRLNSSHHG